MRTIWHKWSRAILMLATAMATGVAMAQVEYKVPALGDYSGPYADLAKHFVVRDAVFKWWNDTEGKKLGVKLTLKTFDTRNDSSVVSSLWPGILNDMKPVIALGFGGSDTAALQQRLSQDKVPVVYSGPSLGYGWLPNQWIFTPRPTYVHEWAATLLWYINQHPEKKPLRVAIVSSQSAAAVADIANGMTKYINTVLAPKGLATIVATEWIELQPVDLSSQMRKIIEAKADIILGMTTTGMAGAVIRAEQLHGVNIPTLGSPWQTIWPLAYAMKTYVPFEGHLVATGLVSITEKDSKAYKFYQLLQKDYGIPDWNPISQMGISQGLLAVRAVEHAVRKVGAANLTGQAVYDALATGTFTEDELMGLSSTLHFSKDAPFPIKDARVKVETVKDGKYQLATPPWLPIPADVAKW